MSGWQAGVDVGGTNSDLLFLDPETGRYQVSKVATTTADQSIAVPAGLLIGGMSVAELEAVVEQQVDALLPLLVLSLSIKSAYLRSILQVI